VTTTLTLLLRRFVNVLTCDSRTRPSTDSRLRLSLLRRFMHVFARDSRTGSLRDSRIGHLPKFAPSPARGSELPHVRDSTSSPNHDPRISRIRESEASQVPGFREIREFPVPEKHVLRTLSNLTFRGRRVFLNSPTPACHTYEN
jgi:hypothetical protein